eukprot:12851-Heterococcus_DN1.PRE.2
MAFPAQSHESCTRDLGQSSRIGEAVTEVLEKEQSFSNILDDRSMSSIISKFWRTQPEYDNERFNHDLREATKAEVSAFKAAEQTHIAELEARLRASLR